MTDNGKQYRVLREGVSQADGLVAVGAVIRMTKESAGPMVAEGWVEEVAAGASPARRRRANQETD